MTRPTIRVKPYDDQPGKAEHDQTFKADTTPEDLACAVLRPVKVVEDPAAWPAPCQFPLKPGHSARLFCACAKLCHRHHPDWRQSARHGWHELCLRGSD